MVSEGSHRQMGKRFYPECAHEATRGGRHCRGEQSQGTDDTVTPQVQARNELEVERCRLWLSGWTKAKARVLVY